MDLRLRVDFAGLSFGFFLAILFIAPWLRGLFFEPDLLPVLVAMAAALVLLALDAWNRRTPAWTVFAPTDWAVLALTVLYFLSFFPAVDRHVAIVGALRMAGYAAAYILAARYVQRPHGLQRLTWTLFASGCGIALLGWAAAGGWVAFPGAIVSGRLMSALQYPNALAGMLIVTLCIGAGLWNQAKGLPRALAAAGVIVGLVTMLATYSRGGWLAYAAAVALMVTLAPNGGWWSLLLFHAAAGTVAGLIGVRLLPALRAGLEPKHLLLLGAGALAFAVADQLIYRVGDWVAGRITNPLTFSLLRGALIVYMVAIVGWAGFYFSQNVPDAAALLVPTQAAARFGTITGDERSFISRLTTSKDAWRLALARPLLGAGAGGWNALYHQVQATPYWMTEVHNHFMQTAVEVGLTGLVAFTFIWVLSGFATARIVRRIDDGRAMLVWGAAVGLLGLLLHALGDFDLSLPALALWVFALGGLIRGLDPKTMPKGTRRRRRSVRAAVDYPWTKRRHQGDSAPVASVLDASTAVAVRNVRNEGNITEGEPPTGGPLPPDPDPMGWRRRPWLQTLRKTLQNPATVALAALLLAYPAWRLNSAGHVGAAAAQAFARQDWPRAQAEYEEARRLDPWNGSYSLDLAQVNLILTIQGEAAAADGEAIDPAATTTLADVTEALADALRVQPYRPDLRDRAIRLYLLLDEQDLALEQAKALAWLLPKQVEAHESYLELLAARAQRHLRDRETIAGYDDINELLLARTHLFTVLRQAEQRRNPKRLPSARPKLSAAVEFAFARAEYLRGRPGSALAHLAYINAKSFDRPQDLQALQAAAYYLMGEGNLNNLADMDETTQAIYAELLAVHGF